MRPRADQSTTRAGSTARRRSGATRGVAAQPPSIADSTSGATSTASLAGALDPLLQQLVARDTARAPAARSCAPPPGRPWPTAPRRRAGRSRDRCRARCERCEVFEGLRDFLPCRCSSPAHAVQHRRAVRRLRERRGQQFRASSSCRSWSASSVAERVLDHRVARPLLEQRAQFANRRRRPCRRARTGTRGPCAGRERPDTARTPAFSTSSARLSSLNEDAAPRARRPPRARTAVACGRIPRGARARRRRRTARP